MIEGLRRPGTGDNLTSRELNTLGRYRHLGLMRYKDLDAFYCSECSIVFNVKCANCGIRSENTKHMAMENSDAVFNVERPLTTIKADGLYWTVVECKKCDFRFRVIVR